MPEHLTEELEGGDAAADAAYRWTIRAMYLGLLAANLYVLWDAYKDTVPALELRGKLRAWWTRANNCEGCAKRKAKLEAAFHRLHWETLADAEEIVRAETGPELEGEAPA